MTTQTNSAMTLTELLIIISVIALLAAISYPIIATTAAEAQRKKSIMATRAAAVAISRYAQGGTGFTIMTTAGLRPMWDLNKDGIIDGDPTHPAAPADLSSIAPSWYRGFAFMTEQDEKFVDASGHMVDGWKSPLRIAYDEPEFEPHTVGVWSIGKDRTDQIGADDSDDLCSWKAVEP